MRSRLESGVWQVTVGGWPLTSGSMATLQLAVRFCDGEEQDSAHDEVECRLQV